MKVLIIRLGAIGDVVHATIIADMIKNSDDSSVVDFLSAKYITDLLNVQKSVRKTFPFDLSKKDNLLYLTKLGLELRKEKYDIVFVLTNSFRCWYLTRIINPKKIIPRNKLVNGIEGFYTTGLKLSSDFKKPKKQNFQISDELKSKVAKYLGDGESPIVVFNPCGLNDKRRQGRTWRDTYWIELGNKLSEKYGARIFVTGSKEEAQVHQIYSAIKGAVILSGQLSLLESASVFASANLVIAGDSGPVHISAAVGAKTLSLLGSTGANVGAPYGENGYYIDSNFECRHCEQKKCKLLKDGEKYTPCMDAITPDTVLKFIEKENLL